MTGRRIGALVVGLFLAYNGIRFVVLAIAWAGQATFDGGTTGVDWVLLLIGLGFTGTGGACLHAATRRRGRE